jgi:hypothetical protein
MKFEDIEKGSVVYYADIKNSELVDGEIKLKQVQETKNYYATGIKEILFTDGTMIMPDKTSSCLIKNQASLSNVTIPFSFMIYSCDYDICLKRLKEIVDEKIYEVNEIYKSSNIQLTRLCLINSSISNIEDKKIKEEIVLDTVYTD